MSISTNNVTQINEFLREKDLFKEFNTTEAIDDACLEHTLFNKDRIEKSGLVVIPIEYVSFDFDGMTWQCRVENLDKETWSGYLNQAKNGVEIPSVEGLVYGIREPITVAVDTQTGSSHRFQGLKGHHRFKAASEGGYKYIVCKVDLDWWGKSDDEKLDELMLDNGHVQNGKKSTPSSLKNSLTRWFGYRTTLQKEKNSLKSYQQRLDQPITDEERESLTKSRDKVVSKIKKVLTQKIGKWSQGSMKKATQKTYATNVFNEWNSEEITNIVIPEDSDQEECHTKDMINQPKGVMGKLFSQTIKHNSIDDRLLLGKLMKDLSNYRTENGYDATKFVFHVVLKSASSIRKLHELRLKLASQIRDVLSHRYSDIELEFKYLGQIRAPGQQYEDKNKYYTEDNIRQRLKLL